MAKFEYIRNYYGVDVKMNQCVTVNGRKGLVIADKGAHLGVNFDDDKPGVISFVHPTWKVEYGDIGVPRKPTASQQRYQRFLEYGDSFSSFVEYCRWDGSKERSWNGGVEA